jgi:hypothetical protein
MCEAIIVILTATIIAIIITLLTDEDEDLKYY